MRIEQGVHANIVMAACSWGSHRRATRQQPDRSRISPPVATASSSSMPALELDNVVCLQLDHSYTDGEEVSQRSESLRDIFAVRCVSSS